MDNIRTTSTANTQTNNTRGYFNNNFNNNSNANSNNNNRNNKFKNKKNNNKNNTANNNNFNNIIENNTTSLPHIQQHQHQTSPRKFQHQNFNQFDSVTAYSLDFNNQSVQTNIRNNNNKFTLGNNINVNNTNQNNINNNNGGGKKKVNNKRKGSNSNNTYYNNNNNGFNKNNQRNSPKSERLNKSLNKDYTSPNSSFGELSSPTSKIPQSISLETFEADYIKVRRSPTMPNSLEILTPSTSSCATEPSSTTNSLIHQQFPSTILEQETFEDEITNSGSRTSLTTTKVTTETFSTPMNHLHPVALNSNGNTSDEPTSDENQFQKSSSSSSSPDSRINSNDVTTESQMLVTASEGEYSFKTDKSSNIENTITNMTATENNEEEIVEIDEHKVITAMTFTNELNRNEREVKNDETDSSLVQADQSNISSTSTEEELATKTNHLTSIKQNDSSTTAAVDNVLSKFNELLISEETNANEMQQSANPFTDPLSQNLDEEASSKYLKIEEEEVSDLVGKIVLDVITQAVHVPQTEQTTQPVSENINEPTAVITDAHNISFTKNECHNNSNELNIVEIIATENNKLSSQPIIQNIETVVENIEHDVNVDNNTTESVTTAATQAETTLDNTTISKKSSRVAHKKESVVDCFSCTIA